MTNQDSPQPRRRTNQQEQERISRSQFTEALHTWICNSLEQDYGEDFTVSIYEDGKSTGLTFLAQLKSTTDWRRFVPKQTPEEIHYSLEVKDLKHWADTAPPVVIVVWDVQARCGFWQDVPSIIKHLKGLMQEWDRNETITVVIPVTQTLDTDGCRKLRHRIGHLSLPSLSVGKELEIASEFLFANDDQGQASALALRQAIEEGNEITVQSVNIASFKLSPWWERIFGASVPDAIKISPGHQEDICLRLVLTATGTDRCESVPLDLHHVKAGTKLTVLENDTSDPIHVRVTLDQRSRSVILSLHFECPGKRVQDSLQVTRVLRIVREGGHIHFALSNGHILAGAVSIDPSRLPDVSSLVIWERLLTVLAEIQPKVAKYGYFTLINQITTEDLRNAQEMRAMCTRALWETRMTISMNFKDPVSLPTDVPRLSSATADSVEIGLGDDISGDVVLFGVRVPLGRVRIVFQDGAAAAALLKAQAEQSTKIDIIDAPVLVKYLDWEPPLTGPDPVILSK